MLSITIDWRKYAMAIAAALGALALRFMLDPILGSHMPFYLCYFAVFITAVIAGPGPGTVVLVTSGLAAAYLFVQPRLGLGPLEGEGLAQVIRFATLGTLLLVAGVVVRSLRLRLDEETRERLRVEQMGRRAVDNALRVLASVGDGLITTDDRGRITFMNAAAEELTGWFGGSAVGRHAADVFRIVDMRTKETIPDPVVRSLREEKVVSIPPRTVLIRRDGTERTVDDSAAPIRDESGQIVGSVLVFRGTGNAGEPVPTRLEILEIHLVPLHDAQSPLPADRLLRLEQQCRFWLLKEWVMEHDTLRIVPFDEVQVFIHLEGAETMPSGSIGARFLVAYELWEPSAAVPGIA